MTQSNSSGDMPDAIREEATAWLLRDEIPHCRSDSFESWLAQSAQHRQAWDEVQSLWQMLPAALPHYDRLTSPREPSAPAKAPAGAVRRRVSWAGSGARIAAGGGLLAMLSLSAWIVMPGLLVQWQADYRTSVAETRAVVLEDGSVVQLGAKSAIKAHFTQGRREITLLAGEAFFNVVHDAARPFVVDAQNVKVEVVGTEFDVGLGKDTTDVVLARGVVRVSLPQNGGMKGEVLSPGDRLTVDRRSGETSLEKVAPEDIGAWRSGRLFVVNSSIGAVIDEIQRYHPAWITIPDRSLSNTRVTGIYDLSDPDKALAALVSPFGGNVYSLADIGRVVTRY